LKSIEDLERVRDEARAHIRIRSSAGSPRVTIGMGTCGIAAGARETMLAIIDELKKRQQLDVTITETGCVGLCAKEPIVEVQIPGEPKVAYGNVDAARARQIVVSHLVNRKIVDDWVINIRKEDE
jgi:NADP-reducing hydrogenase subunit HndB